MVISQSDCIVLSYVDGEKSMHRSPLHDTVNSERQLKIRNTEGGKTMSLTVSMYIGGSNFLDFLGWHAV